MRTTVITITPGATPSDRPTLNHNDCHVSCLHGDRIKWEASAGGDFAVDFPAGQSPFDRDHFDQAHPISSAPAVPQRTTPYKYTVTVPGNLPLDPEVIVDQ